MRHNRLLRGLRGDRRKRLPHLALVGQVGNLRRIGNPPGTACTSAAGAGCPGHPLGRAQDTILPHIAAKPQRGVAILRARGGASKGGRRVANPPQIANLPHNSSRRAKNVMDSSTIGADAQRAAGARSTTIKLNVPGSTGGLPLPPAGASPNFAETRKTR